MTVLSVRVADELAARFDAAAAGAGGRSALLHQLVRSAAAPEGAGGPPPSKLRDSLRMMVRLAAPEASHVRSESQAMGIPPATWVAGLVGRHAGRGLHFSRPAELSIVATQGEIRRIGVNINQIARALNTAVIEGRVLAAELSSIEALRVELRAHMEGLREAFHGNLVYWEAGW